jgi:DNA-binding transcriptional ArsR family regulator/MFS family permease
LSAPPPAPLPGTGLGLLGDANLRLYIGSRFFAGIAYTLLRATIAWQLYEVSGSALSLGVMGLVQFVPTLLSSLPAGALADTYDRRRIVVLAQALALCASGVLALQSFYQAVTETVIYAALLVTASAASIENPSGASLLPMLVRREVFPSATALNASVRNLSWVSGPVIAGFVIEVSGPGGAYALHALLLAISALGISRLRVKQEPAALRGMTLEAIREGIAFVRSRPLSQMAASREHVPVEELARTRASRAVGSWRSAAGEARRAAGGHGGHALLEVRGALQPLLLGALPVGGRPDATGEITAHGLADGADRERRRERDLSGQRAGSIAQLGERRQHIAEPHRVRLLAPDAPSGVEQLERALLTDERGERHGEAEALVEAEPREIRAEARLGRRDPEVRHQRQAEPPAHGRALHGGDHRRARLEEPHGLVVQMPSGGPGRGPAVPPAEIRARAEVLALGAEHDRAAVRVGVQRLERLAERVDQRDVEEVVGRPPDLRGRHVVVRKLDPHIPMVSDRHRFLPCLVSRVSRIGCARERNRGNPSRPGRLTCIHWVAYSDVVDEVFKALADRTRRRLLDRLRRRDGQTLGELCSGLAMSRQAATKHLGVLEAAGLVVTRWSGREKHHYLNPVPIRRIADRWITKYAERWSGALEELRTTLEEKER